MRDKLLILFSVLACIGLGYFFPQVKTVKSYTIEDSSKVDAGEEGLVVQQKTRQDGMPHTVTKIYLKDQVLGVLHDQTKLDDTLDLVYQEKYEEKFPDAALGLGEDVYVVNEESYYVYEDADRKILDYLVEHDLFSVVTNKIEFSNGAVIYVKNVEDFTNAREKYLLNFISKDVYELLKQNKQPAQLATFGEQEISLSVAEKVTVSEGLAAEKDIMTTEEEVLEFLSYSYGVEKEYYTVKKYDTVQAVALYAKTGVNTQQLITINPGVLFSEDQALEEGMELNITYFDSPLTVTVVKERLEEETVYPKNTKYIYDSSLDYGTKIYVTREVIGKRNVRYYDTYVNGILTDGEEISSVMTVQPVQEVVRIGTGGYGDDFYYEGGTGSFQWPAKHHKVICGWLCYTGHYAIDIVDRYKTYSTCYAADSGKCIDNSYDSIGGYHITISHGDDTYTYYGHFRQKSAIKVGEYVEKGQAIGRIGMTGYATCPHIHFEIWVGGRPWTAAGHRINPCTQLGC